MRRIVLISMLFFCVAAAAQSAVLTQNDVLVGNGGSGPYRLTWSRIKPDTVTVTKNHVTLVRGIDYTVDRLNGQIHFSKPLGAKDSAIAVYQYDAAVAHPNNWRTNQPLVFDPKAIWRHNARRSSGLKTLVLRRVIVQHPIPTGADNVSASASTQTIVGGGGDSLNTDQLVNWQMHVAAAPKVGADFGFNQFDPVADPTESSVSTSAAVTMSASKQMSVTAGTTQSDQGTVPQTEQTDLGVNLSPDPTLHVNTTVNMYHLQTDQYDVASVTGTVKPATDLEVDAGYQSHMGDDNDPDVEHRLPTTNMKVAIQAPSGVKVYGTYTQNPADGFGNSTQEFQRGLGLQDSLGPVQLTGGYNWTAQPGDEYDATSLQVGVDWKLSKFAHLIGGYSLAINAPSQEYNTYTFGFQHNIGSAFNLSLTSTINQDPTATGSTANCTTTANVGAQF